MNCMENMAALPEVAEACKNLSQPTANISDDDFQLLQQNAVLLYDRTSECQTVNELQKALFAKGRQLDRNYPPSRSCFEGACKTSNLPWGPSMGPVSGSSATTTIS